MFCFLKKYGVFLLFVCVLTGGVYWNTERYTAYLIENEKQQQAELKNIYDSLQDETAMFEKSVKTVEEENLAVKQKIKKIEQKLNEINSYDSEITSEDAMLVYAGRTD